jgi:hypothetical protein
MDIVNYIVTYDETHNASYIAEEYAHIDNYSSAVQKLRDLRYKMSKNDFRRILHYNSDLPFNKHLIYITYKLHGYVACKDIINEFYDGNPEYLFHDTYNIYREEKLKLYTKYI